MTRMNLFGRLLSRLSVGRKLMLIYLLDLSAVIYVSSILINEKFIAIDFARKEIAGNAYLSAVRDGLIDAALSGAGHAPEASVIEAHAARLPQTEAAHGAGMQSADLNIALAQAYARLAASRGAESATAVGSALAAGRDLVTRVGNQSNLILDPDLDSYYTMSLIVLR